MNISYELQLNLIISLLIMPREARGGGGLQKQKSSSFVHLGDSIARRFYALKIEVCDIGVGSAAQLVCFPPPVARCSQVKRRSDVVMLYSAYSCVTVVCAQEGGFSHSKGRGWG
jgi:hypothetical protein